MAVLLPIALLLIQLVLVALAPHSVSRPAAYLVMVLAPLLAGAAVLRRGAKEKEGLRSGWRAVALAMGIWALGAWGNLWQELVLGRVNEMYRLSMLAFNLAAMPIAFLLAGEGRTPTRSLARVVDAVLAAAMSYGFFLFTWETLTTHATADEASIGVMVWLLDALNAYIALGALVRWYAADDHTERELFGALGLYLLVYTAIIFANNHFIAPDPQLGPEQGTIISIAFAVLGGAALSPARPERGARAPAWLIRLVRTVSPMMLVSGLLFISLLMIRVDYPMGTAGVLLAVAGYGIRTTLNQVRFLEAGETLQRERSELQSIALTDALTGVANRRFLDRELTQTPKGQQLAVLMIDIDHFKLLNDRLGHQTGDGCLREVATALARTLGRSRDVLARYGGEEFVALLRETELSGALVVAERLRASVEKLRLTHPGSPFEVVTVSIGVASGRDPAPLIAAADRALYEAKRAGRNRVQAG